MSLYLSRLPVDLIPVAERAQSKVQRGQSWSGVRTPQGSRLRRRYGSTIPAWQLLHILESEYPSAVVPD